MKLSFSRAQILLIKKATESPNGVEISGREWLTAKALDGRGVGIIRMGIFKLNDRSRDLLTLGYIIGKTTR
jgi:hypothetical protein